jgi:uncharacterized protein (DUF608 family)
MDNGLVTSDGIDTLMYKNYIVKLTLEPISKLIRLVIQNSKYREPICIFMYRVKNR